MKKFLAMLCALTMSVAVFAGCGDTDSSSDETTTTTTAAAAAEGDETPAEDNGDNGEATADGNGETPADDNGDNGDNGDNSETPSADDGSSAAAIPAALDGTLTGKMMADLSDGSFAIGIDAGEEGKVVMEITGKDYHMAMESDFMTMDMYLVDGVMYIMDPASKSYSKMEYGDDTASSDMNVADTIGLGETDDLKFIGSETVDGLTCETFESSDASEGTSKFYFDADGSLKKIEVISDGETTSADITTYSPDIDSITLPDLSGWTEASMFGEDDGLEVDE